MPRGKRKPKFRVGQVVRHRVDGGFYSRIVRVPWVQMGFLRYEVIEQGKFANYYEFQLRPLTRRESGHPTGRRK